MAMKCSIFWGSLLYPWTSLIVIILFLNVHIKPKFILDPLGTSVHWFNPVSQQIILYFCEVSYLSWAQLLVFKKKNILNSFNSSLYIIFWRTFGILFLVFLSQNSFPKHQNLCDWKLKKIMRPHMRTRRTMTSRYFSLFFFWKVKLLLMGSTCELTCEWRDRGGSPVVNNLFWIFGLNLGE